MNVDTASQGRPSPLTLAACVLATAVLAAIGMRPPADDRIPTGVSTLAAVTNSDAALSTLDIAGGSLEPVFAANVNRYTLRVAPDVTSVAITPTLSDPAGYVRVDAAASGDGATTAVALAPDRKRVELTVTAADHTTARTIVLSIARAGET